MVLRSQFELTKSSQEFIITLFQLKHIPLQRSELFLEREGGRERLREQERERERERERTIEHGREKGMKLIIIIPIDAHLESLRVLIPAGVQALVAVVQRHGGCHTLIQLPVVTIYITSNKHKLKALPNNTALLANLIS